MEPYYVGIDLGTTNSSVAILNPYTKQPEVQHIDIGEMPQIIRSVLSLDHDGNWQLGNQAAALEQWRERSIFSIKTELRNDPNFQITIDDHTYRLDQLLAIFIEQLLQKANIHDLSQIEKLCLSVPVHMDEERKAIMEQAVLRLGLPKEKLWFIDEPVSILWDCRNIPGQHVLVFDFGGGTLDMAVMDKYETEDQHIARNEQSDQHMSDDDHDYEGQVLAKIGLDLGGDDLDHVIMRMMIREGKKQGNPVCESIDLNLFDDAERLHKLKTHPRFTFYPSLKSLAERVKLDLGKQERVTVHVPPLLAGVDEGISFFSITIEDFIVQTSALRAKMMTGIQQLMTQFEANSDRTRHDIEAVLLSGGSSLISFVPDLLEELFINARIVWDEAHLQTRISRGNARYTASETEIDVQDAVNATYGIYNHAGKETIVIIEASDLYPIQKVKRVATTRPNQQVIEIMPMVRRNGSDRFENFKRNGQPLRWRMNIDPHPQTMDLDRISVTYEINKSQRLRVKAFDHLFEKEIGIEEISLTEDVP